MFLVYNIAYSAIYNTAVIYILWHDITVVETLVWLFTERITINVFCHGCLFCIDYKSAMKLMYYYKKIGVKYD